MTISATTQGIKPGVCTSSTRPVTPFIGMIIYETDTLLAKVWTGSAWVDYPAGKANTASPTFTGTVVLPATTSIGTVSNTEIGYVDGVTSAIQTQIDSKLTTTTAVTSNRNKVLNGDFKVWQRGTSTTVTSSNGYTADRWLSWTWGSGGSVTTSRQVTGDTTNLPNTQYCARFQRVAANTNLDVLLLGQPFETSTSIQFAGKSVVCSFYIRKGANFSGSGNALGFELWGNTTTNVGLVSLSSGKTNIAAAGVTLTATWQKVSCTGTVGTSVTQIAPVFFYTPVGTAGANDYFEVTGIQVEEGSVATPFEFEDIGTTLAKCQRYYWSGTWVGGAIYDDDYLVNYFGGQFPVTMRATPTLSITAGGLNGHHGVSPTGSSITADSANFTWTGADARTAGAGGTVTFAAAIEL